MRKPIIALVISAALAAGLAPAAASASVAGQVAGAVAGVVLSSAIAARRAKANPITQCTLYDRDGKPVTVQCPADVAAAEAARPVVSAAPPPVPVHAAPLAELRGGPPAAYPADPYEKDVRVAYHSGGLPEARCIKCEVPAPPPVYASPCCVQSAPAYHAEKRYERRDESVYQPRAVTSYLAASGGYTEVIRHPPRVVAVYDAYEHSEERVSGYYESSSSRYSAYGDAYGIGGHYGYGFQGGVGWHAGAYSYGGVGASVGGTYAPGPVYRPRVAGRDPNGFLTWPGKR